MVKNIRSLAKARTAGALDEPKTTHTPGPWCGFVLERLPVAIMPTMRAGDICAFKDGARPTDADFALMIAAPDLLESLKAFLALENFRPSRETMAATQAARAAIAKAEAK